MSRNGYGEVKNNVLRIFDHVTHLVDPAIWYNYHETDNKGCITEPVTILYSNLHVVIPQSVVCIGSRAFSHASFITKITMPNSITSIETGAFINCSKLEEVIYSSGMEYIPVYAFKDCRRLKKIIIPSSVKRIEEFAFENCKSLTGIVIPYSVTDISGCAFNGCPSLCRIVVPINLLDSCGDLSRIADEVITYEGHVPPEELYETYIAHEEDEALEDSIQNPGTADVSEHVETNFSETANEILENACTQSHEQITSNTTNESKSNYTVLRFDGVIRNNPIKKKKV